MYITKTHSIKTHPVNQSDPWVPLTYVVTDKIRENDNMFTLVLAPEDHQSLPPIAPGQFNMLYVFGVGEIPISVSSLASAHPLLTHTIQAVGAVSGACCKLETGDLVGVRGPFGTPWPLDVADQKDLLIMAGGVGLAPLRPLIEQLLKNRSVYGDVNVLYGTRNPDMIIFHRDIISLQSDETLNFQITVDHSYTSWRGNVGVVTTLLGKAKFDPENTISYVCGPEIMMRYGAHSLLDAGIPEDRIYLSMERNMKCGIAHCGHCQYGPLFVCKDGPVFSYAEIRPLLNIREL